MTTLTRYEGTEEVFRRLESVRARRYALGLATGIAAVIAIAMGTIIAAALICGYWPDQPPVMLRWGVLISACGVLSGAVVWYLLAAVFWRQNLAQTARAVEQAIPDLHNDLINTVLLSRDSEQASPDLVQEAIREAVRRSRDKELDRSVSPRSLKRWGLACAVTTVVLAAFALLQPGPFHRGLTAAVAPGSFVPHVNGVELVSLSPQDATVFAGERVVVLAKVRDEGRADMSGEVLLEHGAAPPPMLPGPLAGEFICDLGPAKESFSYAVRIGDSRWPADRPYYRVTVLQRVEVEGLDVRYEYPPYTKLPPRTVTNADGNLEAPMGSRAKVTVRLRSAVPTALLEVMGASDQPMRPEPDGLSFTATIPISSDGAYRMVLKDAEGHALQQLPDISRDDLAMDAYGPRGQALMKGYYRISALPDAPPKVEFQAPNRDVTVAPGGKLAMRIRAQDKYGLAKVELFAGKEGEQPKAVPAFPPSLVAGKQEARLDYAFDLSAYSKGDVVVYYAAATDNRDLPGVGGPQTTASSRFKILLENAAELEAEKARRYEELRKELLKLLRMQESQRVNTAICWTKHQELQAIRDTAKEISAAQKDIRVEMIALVEKFPFEQELVTVQQALALLANNEARLAADQADVLAALAEMTARNQTCYMLASTQDKIIDTLQTLLAIMPSLMNREAAEATAAGGDLPPEAREQLRKLREHLEQFIEEQKKVIEAGRRLSKQPVDDFQEAELLKELQAVQDKWENFLNEAITDFSKLAEQDFSNPALLKELIAVKSDVTMAKDALAKKAIEIATAVEDNGIENAESLTANIEKWLPDEPDRVKWSMEDFPEQENIEQAELPTELEDLVGDLLEEEEDLFDEMDDLSSTYAGSFDKGAGWDAMDGPISSMNAQGVTGNQLPNTNEMQGRSGEGRTGKSSGEFVEDTATGKGGRRTPTRLTPDAFQEGQVDDVSDEPPGGATGGGKLSGSGEEGLEGPVPPPLAKEMQRLAGKQAAIINNAERIRAKFEVNDYRNFEMLRAITLMNRVRGDLEQGRYQNVLRARHQTIAALRQSKLLLAGKIDVSADTSSTMPKYIRDEIADAMQGKLPEEYKEVLRQYYRRLSEGEGE